MAAGLRERDPETEERPLLEAATKQRSKNCDCEH
jgi:hypothetical protein